MITSVQEILEALDLKPTTAGYLTAAAKLDRLVEIDLPQVRIAILRNYTVETFLPTLKVECYRTGVRPEFYLNDFDVIEQEVLDPNSGLYASKPDVIVVALRIHSLSRRLMMSFGELGPGEIAELSAGVLDRVTNILSAIRRQTPSTVLLHNFELPDQPALGFVDSQSPLGLHNVIRRMNLDLLSLAAAVRGVSIVDVEYLCAQVGYRNAIDQRYWQIGKTPYTLAFNVALAREYAKPVRSLKGKTKKCLVLDCDNTLWGGVVGEDGINGIKLGKTHPGSSFVDLHLAILDLYHRGVLLALCSKNNEADVLDVLSNHPDCRLKEEHFVATRINWSDKARNLREIALELNIGLDSLVFLDDSEFECDLVRSELSEVLTVQLSGEPSAYRSLLQGLGVFDTLSVGDEDRQRSSMYRADSQRKAALVEASSIDEYLRSLEMVLTIAMATDFAIPRIAQLTQKTNQFNLTTRRYSEGEIRALSAASDTDVYFAELKDRFDSTGIIAVAIVRTVGESAEIDSYLMSCRVIGRGVEQALLAHIVDRAASTGVTRLVGRYLPTIKNALAQDFYEKSGFTVSGTGSDGAWELNPQTERLEPPHWFKNVNFGNENSK